MEGPIRATIEINRAPVLTLWAAVVAERLGFKWDEALSLGRAVAGLDAHAKGVHLGLFTPSAKTEKKRGTAARKAVRVDLLGRGIPALQTPDGVRALSKDKAIDPGSVKAYLENKFGDALADALAAMRTLAKSLPPAHLADRAFHLYEDFRPQVPKGAAGWGATGRLDLSHISRLAKDVQSASHHAASE